MAGSIIDADKLQNEKFIRKPRKFVCGNIHCKAELHVSMSDKEYEDRFFFCKNPPCIICGIGKMFKEE